MSEIDAERRIEAAILSRREVHAGYSPALNRLLHLSESDLAHDEEENANERAAERELRYGCVCYPKGMVSWSRAYKAQLKADHIKAGVHSVRCPMYCEPKGWSYRLRSTETDAPSYTLQQQRRDEDAESLEMG